MARYQSFPFQGFGRGLNLRDKPDAVDPAECIDAMNVLFSDRGAIQQRPGYAAFTGTPLPNRPDALSAFYTSAGTKQLLAGCGTRLEALDAAGSVLKSATGLTGGPWTFARFGQPNAEVAYAGNGLDTVRKWTGVDWLIPTATVDGVAGKPMPRARFVAVQPSDNRLVTSGFSTTSGGPNGAVSSPSHVYFSEAGNPEGYETTAYVQLTPGDGERIQGVIAWREFIFVFKESQFFVFYGNSTDEEGRPVFNYRPVTAGVGLASPRALCADPSGVYFLSRQGVYRTTGQEPELVSSAVGPVFAGGASVFYKGGILAASAIDSAAMVAHGGRIYLSFPTLGTSNTRTLVFDPQYEWWTLYDLACAAMATFRPSATDELVFAYASGQNRIGRHADPFTNDAGNPITSTWRSGWFDLGSADVKRIRASKVWGTGKVTMGLAVDFASGTGTLTNLDFGDPFGVPWGGSNWGGTTWAVPKGLLGRTRRVAARGTAFSLSFHNSIPDQSWSVHRLEHLIPQVRNPAVITA